MYKSKTINSQIENNKFINLKYKCTNLKLETISKIQEREGKYEKQKYKRK